jgi:23S rRNA pseudouridine2605 synthase
VNGVVRRDAEWCVDLARDAIEVDGRTVSQSQKVYVMLNKPRGLVTTAADEQGRTTVFSCLQEYAGRHMSAVGRLDKASEGLLLLTNDTQLAARLTEPGHGVLKTYHVQVNRIVDVAFAERLQQGVEAGGERLACAATRVLRTGTSTSWLEILLDEGKNRHIRRLLEAFGIEVLRLVRVAVGPLALGNLAKGKARELTPGEVKMISRPASQPFVVQEPRHVSH